jgi:glutathione peroxidase
MRHSLLYIGFIAGLSLSTLACFDAHQVVVRPVNNPPAPIPPVQTAFFDLKVNTLEGKPADLSAYKGKKIVVLNVASKCGYTPQYADWQRFYEIHKDSIAVLGFPCNDFMGQEPGSADDIAAFCQKNYGVTFPMFEKVTVKGDAKSPVYAWLTDPAQNGWNDKAPSWNFCKYVLNKEGKLTHFFASKMKPDAPEFKTAVGIP